MNDLVAAAAGVRSLTTLVAAIEITPLSATLKQPGPFTLFAPSDQAFDGLQRKIIQEILHSLPRLTAVLSYHVVPGLAMAADLMDMATALTLQGQDLTIGSADGITIDGAHIIQADIEADNGVIHIIDMVLMPSAQTG